MVLNLVHGVLVVSFKVNNVYILIAEILIKLVVYGRTCIVIATFIYKYIVRVLKMV